MIASEFIVNFSSMYNHIKLQSEQLQSILVKRQLFKESLFAIVSYFSVQSSFIVIVDKM